MEYDQHASHTVLIHVVCQHLGLRDVSGSAVRVWGLRVRALHGWFGVTRRIYPTIELITDWQLRLNKSNVYRHKVKVRSRQRCECSDRPRCCFRMELSDSRDSGLRSRKKSHGREQDCASACPMPVRCPKN